MLIAVWLVLAVCAVASFFFALAETALFSLGKWQTQRLLEKNSAAGRVVAELLAQPQELLATLALGNTFANAVIVAVVAWSVLEREWGWAAAILGALLLLLLLGAEVIPKTLAVRDPERWALRVAAAMRLFLRITRPLRRLAQWLSGALLAAAARRSIKPTTGLSDAEYQELLDLACQQGALGASEKEIILQIIALDRRTVREVMKPRARMVAISDECSVAEMMALARRHKSRRIPIYDETPDTIVGVLNTQALLLKPDADLSEVIEFPAFVPASMNLLQLLRSLQRQQRVMAIVLDEFGGTAGVVTVEDILEEVVGEIREEGEAEGFVMEKVSAGRWRVSGAMRLDDFRRECPELPDLSEVETVGGLVMSLLEVVPRPGDKVQFQGLSFKVIQADERRVREVLIEKITPAKVREASA
mgnify:CR=1 FL=1